jgi:hypothetical protein
VPNRSLACAKRMMYGNFQVPANDSLLLPGLAKAFGDVHDCVGVLTLGDEIGIGGPAPGPGLTQAEIDAGFVAWLNSDMGLADNASAAGCDSWADCHYNATPGLNATNPRLWYYSSSYGFTFGLREFARHTEEISKSRRGLVLSWHCSSALTPQ